MSRRRRAVRAPAKEWLVATPPGLGRLAATDLREQGVPVDGVESDGRSDLVAVGGPAPPAERALALAEDLFLVVGTANGGGDARAVTRRLFDETRWRAGAEIAAQRGARVGATTGFRVIARVRSEREFKRTELRDAVTEQVLRWRPRWRVRDPADLEFWVLETRKGIFRATVRISSGDMRSRGGRAIEREGALRPAVAAALVRAAGRPSGLLVDPFCGSGTVLGEARRAGWSATGSDVDADAVAATRANQPGIDVNVADATRLDIADGAAAAVVTNAPFGIQHVPRTGGRDLTAWWGEVLAEMRRVVRVGGSIVILHPDDEVFRRAIASTKGLREAGRTRLRTLGRDAVIWTLVRGD